MLAEITPPEFVWLAMAAAIYGLLKIAEKMADIWVASKAADKIAAAALVAANTVALKVDAVKEAASKAADKVADKVEVVKKEAAEATRERNEQLAEIKTTAHATHILVNSERGELLRALATALRAVALAHPTMTNLDAADKAENNVTGHDKRQAETDAQIKGK